MTTTDRDMGHTRIVRELEAVDGAYVDVGLFEGETHPDTEFTVPQIGAVHEFGSTVKLGRSGAEAVRIPERSFLRSTEDEQGDKLQRAMEAQLDRVLQGKTNLLSAMAGFGEMVASEVRRKITTGPFEPKAPATLAREGERFTRPLVWLGYMRAAVRARIVLRGRKTMTPKKGPAPVAPAKR